MVYRDIVLVYLPCLASHLTILVDTKCKDYSNNFII